MREREPGAELAGLLAATPCGCGRCRRVGTERVLLTDDLGAAVLAEPAGAGALLFGDPRTLAACGRSLAEDLGRLGHPATVIDLEQDHGPLHADQNAVQRVARRLAEAAPATLPVAVGSGTINDVVKAASHESGRRYVSVPTAPSMNGYTSAIAAITRDGLKRTLASTPPVAVLASPRVLVAAPRRMAVSGLADLLSKPVSSADWRLAHLLWDEPYCPVPAELAGEAVERAVVHARALRGDDGPASLALFEALLLSGISMAVAGSSSPASGGEHLISHYLDMTAAVAPGGPRRPALHGEQVGVATRVTTRLYALLLSLTEDRIDWDRAADAAPEPGDVPGRLARVPWLPAPLLRLFVREGSRKLERLGGAAARVGRIRERWELLRAELRPGLEPAASYLDVLPSIGAPVCARDIAVSAGEFRLACRVARWTRDRYTILDLADDLGLFDELEDEALSGIVSG